MAESLLRLQAVMDRVGLKRSKIYALISEDKFPPPVKIDGAARWPESKVEAWMAERIAESEDARAA